MKAAAAIFLAACLAPTMASAKFVCLDQFQYVAGSWVATPLCSDINLTNVAREYGAHPSYGAVMNSDSKKRQICNFIGFDRRAELACANYGHGNGLGSRN